VAAAADLASRALVRAGALPFADDAAIRRVHSEGILLLGGGRALLMQIAHPAIAKGVYEHSTFQASRLERLLRTLRPMLAIAFGTREQALAAAATVNRTHVAINGDGYSARDPDLLQWVLATLIDTSLVMHDRFVRPLPPTLAAQYYADMKQVGTLLGLPAERMPDDLDSFHHYVEETTTALPVSAQARELALALFRPSPGPWALIWPFERFTAGLLPPPLRDQFGLTWGPGRELALNAFAAASSRLLPIVPKGWRRPPAFLMPR
jgi:uncharacterized protein (DUF2236 family)